MTWLTWRQFRAQALAGLAALLLLGIYLLTLGLQIRSRYHSVLTQCRGHGDCAGLLASFTSEFNLPVTLLGYLLVVVPAVVGMFWGAPLITRELELGTHRLVWNQSVTRKRWLAAKLGLVGLCGTALAGGFSLLLTWAASPFDRLQADRFTPVLFGERNIAPIGYTAFAFVLGAALGLFVRRTLPAMALTLVLFTVVQILVPGMVRPHLAPPVRSSVQLTRSALGTLDFLGQYGTIGGLETPDGDWVVSTSPMLDSAGEDVGHTALYAGCLDDAVQSAMLGCLARADLHVEVTEQPADRYWSFQWYETAIFAALAGLLAVACFWRIRGRLS